MNESYRPEIDGLRALAVLSVLLFHAGFTTLRGGFIGVDIFFVISGWLITSAIVAKVEAGTFQTLKFYERRARRILPCLYFVMIATAPFALYWMPPGDLIAFSKSILAVLTFISNIYFWQSSSYFDTHSELKPLLHTWSLGVEEQFYILFPIAFGLFWKFGKRVFIYVLVTVAIMSLLLAQWSSTRHPTADFYSLPTRAFEMLIGSLAFLSNAKLLRWKEQKTGECLSLLGMTLIVYAILAFDLNTPLPSTLTLILVMGTALILTYAAKNNLVGRLLGKNG
jgi:peptidoglycan/LPS O-acetylase OafA/YrhL